MPSGIETSPEITHNSCSDQEDDNMIDCSEMKKGQIYRCEDCGLELQVVHECQDCGTEGSCAAAECTFKCCDQELKLKA